MSTTSPESILQFVCLACPLLAGFYAWRWGLGRAGLRAVLALAAAPTLTTLALPLVSPATRAVLGLAAVGALLGSVYQLWPRLRAALDERRWVALELLALWAPYLWVFAMANTAGVPGPVELLLTGAAVVCIANVMPRLIVVIVSDLLDD